MRPKDYSNEILCFQQTHLITFVSHCCLCLLTERQERKGQAAENQEKEV